MANPWMKFYPRDWRGDQALRAVSIAARGLWMECLCIMHEAAPYGHLVLNGNPVEDDTLARMAGVSVDEVARLMAELRQAGVLSVTRKGVIFSRRMTKDHALAQKGKAAAKKRWGPSKLELPQASDKKQKSDAPNRCPNGLPITQKPEARSQIKKEEPNGSLSSGDDEARQAVESYNLAAGEAGWPKVQTLSKSRQSALKARLAECGGLEGWVLALAKARASPLCNGQNDRGWTANFDFLTRQSSFAKLMEGNYDARQSSRPPNRAATQSDAFRDLINDAAAMRRTPGADWH